MNTRKFSETSFFSFQPKHFVPHKIDEVIEAASETPEAVEREAFTPRSLTLAAKK